MPPQFFEGPEKKVELILAPGRPSLRAAGDPRWEAVVRAARAQVLSKRSTDAVDAYLLSESSLFVWDDHFTLITCGATRMADAVEEALTFVRPEDVAFLALERKNEHFPHEQPTSFYDDARRLQRRVPGRAIRFGDEHSHCIQLFHSERPFVPDADDVTLEVLMHGIYERAAAFRGERPDDVARARATGVGEVLPGFAVDDYQFTPNGYSLNAIRGRDYFTLHVTPERLGSYASFETNADFRADPDDLVRRVVEVFRPESFDVLAFVPGGEPVALSPPGYRVRKHVHDPDVAGYAVTFQHFYRPSPSPERPAELEL